MGKLVRFLKVVCQFWARQVPGNIVHVRYCSPIDSVLGGRWENLLDFERVFVGSGTDKSLCVPGNIVHLRCSNPFDSVLGGL